MFLDTKAAMVLGLFFGVIGLAAGAVIAWCVARLVYRSRVTTGLVVRAVIFGSVMFVAGMLLSGWADNHAYFLNGRRSDMTPWGENLWLRNRLAEHGLLIAVLGSCGAGLLAGIRKPAARA
jgi:hypothetical protein